VILCRSADEAARALEAVRAWTAEAGLTLHPTKTRIVNAKTEAFDFLGYRFEDGTRRPRPKSLEKFKDTIRAKTSRSSGSSLRQIIVEVNRTLRGWFEYYKHSHHRILSNLDAWIRMRLRSILRSRMGKRGRGRGSDHQRWPNAFFAAQGLFCMKDAQALLRQSLKR
jgi:RNA-directed DNA polymerase